MTVVLPDGSIEVRQHPSRLMIDIAVPQPDGEVCLRLSRNEAVDLLSALATILDMRMAP